MHYRPGSRWLVLSDSPEPDLLHTGLESKYHAPFLETSGQERAVFCPSTARASVGLSDQPVHLLYFWLNCSRSSLSSTSSLEEVTSFPLRESLPETAHLILRSLKRALLASTGDENVFGCSLEQSSLQRSQRWQQKAVDTTPGESHLSVSSFICSCA